MYTQKDIAKSILELGPQLIRLVKKELQTANNFNLTHPQYRILAQIRRGTNQITEMAAQQGVSQPAMSKMVNIMVKKGLIVRSPHDEDRRQFKLGLTKKGAETFKSIRNQAANNLSKKLENFSKSDLKSLTESIKEILQFIKNLEKAADVA